MVETSGDVIDSVVQLFTEFANIALGVDPMASALLLSGAILTGLSVAVFGYLAAGAALEFLVSLVPSGRQPPQRE
jgi:hypothetical protein